MHARVVESLAEIPEAAWDDLLDAKCTPFMRWGFLQSLEEAGCVGRETGWWTSHLTLWRGDSLIAAAPAYIKADSRGDFSRDWAWADLCARAQIPYYPKLILTVPFTPVCGRRILVKQGEDRLSLVAAIVDLGRKFAEIHELSSIHVLYHDTEDCAELTAAGLCPRTLFQFHWHNRNFETHDDWLASLRSKRRNQIRREKREPATQGISLRTVLGEELSGSAERWSSQVFKLYATTINRRMWTSPYLNQTFFRLIFERMPEHVEFVEAVRDGELIAGAFNIATPEHLFGRYWGCHEHHRFLHFNVCLYHSIDECIQRGRLRFEGGAGGSHKLSRDFEPALVYSHHGFIDPRLDMAMKRFLGMELAANREELGRWQKKG